MKPDEKGLRTSIPHHSRVVLCAVLILTVYALLILLLGRIHILAATAAAVLGGMGIATGISAFYGKIETTNMELDRACRTRLLEKFLSGDIPPDGDLTEALPNQKSDYFSVATVQCIDFSGMFPKCAEEHIPNSEFSRVDTLFRETFSRAFGNSVNAYYVPIQDGIQIILNVIGLDPDDLDATARQAVGQIAEELEWGITELKASGLECGGVVSTVYCGRENIVRAKQEADELTAYAELMGDSTPVKNGYVHAELPMELTDKLRRTELENNFMHAITSRNFDQLHNTLDEFVELELHTAARYPDLLKGHLVSHMEQMLSAFSISVREYEAEEAPVVNQFRLLLDMSSAKQLCQQCHVLVSALREYVEMENEQRSDKAKRALRFISEHYADPNICADMIGQTLGLSASYISRILRQNTGMGVVDHIHAARLEKARQLLTETDLSVDDIAVQVGFSSRWTLTRSFKRYEQTTPGAFREMNQKPGE